MKFLVWCVGAMQIVTGFVLAYTTAPGSRWVWIIISVYWFFVGVIAAGTSLAKLVAGKVGAGAFAGLGGRRPGAPAPHKEE